MDDQNIRRIVQEEIRKSAGQGVFKMQNIPYHIHNGLDSPYITSTTSTFVGGVNSDGTFAYAPDGWTITNDSTGFYEIFHNLNSQLYAFSVSCVQSFGVAAVGTDNRNSITVEWVTRDTGTNFDAAFFFTLVLANNRSTTPPSYKNSIL